MNPHAFVPSVNPRIKVCIKCRRAYAHVIHEPSHTFNLARPRPVSQAAQATAPAVVPRSIRLPLPGCCGAHLLTHRSTQACGSASDGPAPVRADSSRVTYPLMRDGGQSPAAHGTGWPPPNLHTIGRQYE